MKTHFDSSVANLRRLACVASSLLLGAVSVGCIAGQDSAPEEDAVGEVAEPLTGYYFWSWGTTTDTTGIDVAPIASQTCFLSGVAGNLNVGGEWYQDMESLARVNDKYPTTGHYWLVAHGGAYTNQVSQRVWQNNPVSGQATCLFETSNVQSKAWASYDPDKGVAPPVKIADLDPNNLRQCFLAGVTGVAGAWNSSATYARVVKKTVTDATHPTTGWYVESNSPSSGDGSHARVEARCVDLPASHTVSGVTEPTLITSGSVSAAAGATNTAVITSGAGIKGCALTGITGALNQNDYSDGALMEMPAQLNGDWKLTVKNGKTATWACVR